MLLAQFRVFDFAGEIAGTSPKIILQGRLQCARLLQNASTSDLVRLRWGMILMIAVAISPGRRMAGPIPVTS
jgi:hypothetical protein